MASLPPLEPPPPMSLSSMPAASASQPGSIPPPPNPPVLASDILREEVAPMAPAQRAIRIWLATFALAFVAAAFAASQGLGPRSPGVLEGALATALVAGFAAVIPAPYAARASLAAIAGLVPLSLGALGQGPLAAIGFEGAGRAGAGLVLVTLLPGALLFRARYRAFRAARFILAVCIGLSTPALYFLGEAALDADVGWLPRACDGFVCLAALTAFAGFMGEETTGGCSAWAALVVTAHAGRLAIEGVVVALASDPAGGWSRFAEASADRYGRWGYLVAGIGEFIGSTLVGYAAFQLLAALFARAARRVDVHRIVGPSAEDERRGSMTTE